MVYHIEYKKIKSYTMQDYDFDSIESWNKAVLDEYNKLRAVKGGKKTRIQPATMNTRDKGLLKRALTHRFENRDKNVGWKVFNDIIGEYLITIDDLNIVQKRIEKMTEFIKIVNSDDKLTSEDPNPSGSALSEVEIEIDTEKSIEEVLRIALLISAHTKKKKISVGGVMGYISRTYPHFKDQLKEIKDDVAKGIREMKDLMNEKGHDEIKSLIELEFPDLLKEGDKKEAKIIVSKVLYYFPPGVYHPTKIYYEMGDLEKEIDIAQLIRKMGHDKEAQNLLNLIRPGGPEWPASAAGKYYIVISNDPMLMATKTTGRTWHSQSCEGYNGAHPQGPFSDVEWGNCIVYVFKDDKPTKGWPIIYNQTKLKGRTILRWGLKNNVEGEWGVGVERRVYPSNKTWGLPVATAVGMILNDRGLMNYKKCRTPYTYGGWSDTMRGANKHIVYAGFTMEGEAIDIEQMVFAPEINLAGSPTISYADLHRLSRASMDIRIKRVLGQNPSIWQFPEVVTRLIRTGDEEIINQLVHHSIAHPSALGSIAKKLPTMLPADWENPNGPIWRAIIAHYNTHPETHKWLVDNHPGFGGDSFIYSAYLNDATSQVCFAPTELMDKLLQYIRDKSSKDIPKSLKCMYHMLYAPNLDEKTYLKILRLIVKYDKEGIASGDVEAQAMFNLLKGRIGISVIIPITSEDYWTFTGDGLDTYFPNGTAYGQSLSPLMTLSEQWRSLYLYDRQSIKILPLVCEWCPWILSKDDLTNGVPLMENVRSREVYNYLWRNREKLEIPSILFCMYSRDSKNFSIPVSTNLVRDAILINAYEETTDLEINDFRYYFQPYNLENRKVREMVPDRLTTIILNEPNRVNEIGFDVVALWLKNKQKHFETFENLVMDKALGDLWEDGNLLKRPENPFDLYKEIEYIDVMQLSASGVGREGENIHTGLVYNFNIPDRMQYQLLTNWSNISEDYDGSYSEYLYLIERGLSQNPNTTSGILERLLIHDHLKEFIANNPKTPVSKLTGIRGGGRENSLYYKYPVEVLTNKGISTKTFEGLWDLTISFLRTEVDEDTDRLFRIFTDQKDLILSPKSGKKNRDIMKEFLQNNENWIRYWRGGSIKRGVFKPFENQNLFKGEGGISDFPIPIVDKKSIIVQFYDEKKKYTLNKLYFVDDTEPLEGHKVKIKGMVYSFDEETNQFTEKSVNEIFDAEEFYEYVPPDERGGPVKKYICESCIEAGVTNQVYKLSEEQLKIHHEHKHPDVEFRYILGEREPEKWKIPNLFVFTDNDPPEGKKKVPQWRYDWNIDKMNEILMAYLNRLDGNKLLRGWNYRPFRIDAPQTPKDKVARISDVLVFNLVDSNNLWTLNLVNKNLDLILSEGGGLFESFTNIPLTKKLLDLTLLLDEKELNKYGLSRAQLVSIHRKILTYPNLPPSYLYELYNISIDDITLNMIKDIRMQMPYEFNEYIMDSTELHQEELD